jgi:hypothetical protein
MTVERLLMYMFQVKRGLPLSMDHSMLVRHSHMDTL